MNKICVTGADGFIGKAICKALILSNKSIRGFVRDSNLSSNFNNIEYISVGDINLYPNWKEKLIGYDCIIHCAAKTNIANEKNYLETCRLVNVEGTKKIAEKSAEAGIKRLIFLSSIKVNGEKTAEISKDAVVNGQKKNKFKYNDIPNPQDPYGISKFEAEKVLMEISKKTGLEVVILRLPLVYGQGVKGNLANLIKLVRSGIPLPFSAINNKRSLIGIDNLVDVLISCINVPSAANKIFLVSDGEDLSTSKLLRMISFSMGRSVRLFKIPVYLLRFIFFLFGRSKDLDRIFGSLQIDNNYACKILNWKPNVSLADGIKKMVNSK